MAHVCFIALTLAGPSGDVWALCLSASCWNSFLRDMQMLMHEKNMCDPYNRERSGSVIECLTRDRGVAGSSLTGVTALWSLSKTHLS